MKKWKMLLYIYVGCLALRLYSKSSGFFGIDQSGTEHVEQFACYQPSVQDKFMSVVINTTLDMLIVLPISLLLYYLLGEKNEYRTLITLLGSWAIYDIAFHVMYYISNS